MRNARYLTSAMAWLAVTGMCLPHVVLAGPPTPSRSPVADIALRDGGILLGQVVNADGTPLPNLSVSRRSDNRELASGATNKDGYFAFAGLRTGTYQVVTPAGVGTYQVWSAAIAPPSAQPGALIVAGDTVRGQYTPENYAHRLAKPLLIGGLIAAAIAIPIAVANANKAPPSGP